MQYDSLLRSIEDVLRILYHPFRLCLVTLRTWRYRTLSTTSVRVNGRACWTATRSSRRSGNSQGSSSLSGPLCRRPEKKPDYPYKLRVFLKIFIHYTYLLKMMPVQKVSFFPFLCFQNFSGLFTKNLPRS